MNTALRTVRRAVFALALSSALASCATMAPPSLGPSEPANLGQLKTDLRTYHRDRYDHDFAAVIARAQSYILARAPQVQRPAIVLDIDETSLSSWPQIDANDFGYFRNGECHLPTLPCGSQGWEEDGHAPVLPATLALYNAARQANVAVFFVTGRRDTPRRRSGAENNLREAGYRDWTGLALRPVNSEGPVGAFKASQRAAIEAQGYTIIANIGDQQSDLDGGHAERGFKLPNPFYFIP